MFRKRVGDDTVKLPLSLAIAVGKKKVSVNVLSTVDKAHLHLLNPAVLLGWNTVSHAYLINGAQVRFA